MALHISSTANARIKQAVALRQGSHRRATGKFLIDGTRELGRALAAGIRLETVYYCPEQQRPEIEPLLELAQESGVELVTVSQAVAERLAYGERREAILAVAWAPQRLLSGLALGEAPLVAVIEGVEKPGNVGAIARSADGAGVSALVLAGGRSGGGSDLWNPNAIRASLGTLFSLPLAAEESAEACLAWLRQQKLAIFAARVGGSVPYTAANFSQPCALVLGSEAEGLSDIWQADDIVPLALPMRGTGDSLNVSSTAAVLFYEALRQRQNA